MKLKWMMVSLMVACMAVFGEQYEDRWFYVSRLLNNDKELADVEELVNHVILQAQDVEIAQMKQDEAKAKGAMALFGEKYGDIIIRIMWKGFQSRICRMSPKETKPTLWKTKGCMS